MLSVEVPYSEGWSSSEPPGGSEILKFSILSSAQSLGSLFCCYCIRNSYTFSAMFLSYPENMKCLVSVIFLFKN